MFSSSCPFPSPASAGSCLPCSVGPQVLQRTPTSAARACPPPSRRIQSLALLRMFLAASILVFVGLLIYKSRRRLPCSLCSDAVVAGIWHSLPFAGGRR